MAELVEVTFDKETRSRSNVAGKMGKLKLNFIVMEYIESLVFHIIHWRKVRNKNRVGSMSCGNRCKELEVDQKGGRRISNAK